MSLRTPLLRQQASLFTRRCISTSAPRRAGAHDDHGHGHEEHASSDANTTEIKKAVHLQGSLTLLCYGHISCETALTLQSPPAFLSPTWRNTFILLTAAVLIYPYLPSPSTSAASPSLSPASFSHTAAPGSEAPLVTRWLAKITPEASVWQKRNEKHLELINEAAGERLLFQEAERPRVLRLKYPSSFEQASPNSIPVGSQIDLADLKVKHE
ncbi:hypothetical protein P7C73_g1791, partial [Tremellales sp. Uapishka_1]